MIHEKPRKLIKVQYEGMGVTKFNMVSGRKFAGTHEGFRKGFHVITYDNPEHAERCAKRLIDVGCKNVKIIR